MNAVPFSESLSLKTYLVEKQFASIDRLITVFHPHFTLHDIRHSRGVLNNIAHIAERAGLLESTNDHRLSTYEIFFLICAAYLHDVGMLIAQDGDGFEQGSSALDVQRAKSDTIREQHHLRSGAFIRRSRHMLGLEESEADIVALIAEGHRRSSVLGGPEFDDRSMPDRSLARVRFIASIFRIADELDLDSNRAPDLSNRFLHMGGVHDPVSFIHWVKHYHTEGISFGFKRNGSKVVTVNVRLRVPDEMHFLEISTLIREPVQSELIKLNPFLMAGGFTMALSEPLAMRTYDQVRRTIKRRAECRILIVDDDPAIGEDLSAIVAPLSFVVTVASSFLEAVQGVLQPVDLAIIDAELPDQHGQLSSSGGLETLRMVKRVSPGTICIVYTAKDAYTTVRDYIEAGARAVLIKGDIAPDAIRTFVDEQIRTSVIVTA